MTTLANSLTTLDNVRDYIGMTGSNSIVDDLLEDLIVRVTELFEKYCGLSQFKSQSYTDYLDGSGSQRLFLDQRPIISIELLAADYDWTWGTDSTYAATDFRVIDDHIVLKDETFPEGIGNIKVTFTAGYAEIPNDLKQACIMEVARLYKRKDTIDVISKSYDAGGSVTKYIDGILPEVKNTLKRYIGNGVY